jgi:hypothetical protein
MEIPPETPTETCCGDKYSAKSASQACISDEQLQGLPLLKQWGVLAGLGLVEAALVWA